MDIMGTIIMGIIITKELEEIKIKSVSSLNLCQSRTERIVKAKPKLILKTSEKI